MKIAWIKWRTKIITFFAELFKRNYHSISVLPLNVGRFFCEIDFVESKLTRAMNVITDLPSSEIEYNMSECPRWHDQMDVNAYTYANVFMSSQLISTYTGVWFDIWMFENGFEEFQMRERDTSHRKLIHGISHKMEENGAAMLNVMFVWKVSRKNAHKFTFKPMIPINSNTLLLLLLLPVEFDLTFRTYNMNLTFHYRLDDGMWFECENFNQEYFS